MTPEEFEDFKRTSGKRGLKYFHPNNNPPHKQPGPSRVFRIWAQIKMWSFITFWVSLFVGCNYLLAEDDKRMYYEYVKECEERKLIGKTPVNADCSEEFGISYKKALGRSPY